MKIERRLERGEEGEEEEGTEEYVESKTTNKKRKTTGLKKIKTEVDDGTRIDSWFRHYKLECHGFDS
jgi:hypothetical protein